MTRVERIESEVADLSHEELSHFRAWFTEYAAQLWDRQIEKDVRAGNLDRLADQALEELRAGRCTEL